MNSDEPRAPLQIHPAPETRDRKRFSGECQDRRRTERDHKFWVHKPQFLVQPPSVVLDLACCWFLVDAALPALLEFEVLDCIGDIDVAALDAGFRHSAVEELAGGSHEGPALPVFLVARLLADKAIEAPTGPSPRTARVAPGTSGLDAAIMELSASSVFGSTSATWDMWFVRLISAKPPPARSHPAKRKRNARGP